MKYFILFLLLLSSLTCAAAVYMQVDQNGNTSYSDSPGPAAVKVDVPTGNSVSSSTPQPTAKQTNMPEPTGETVVAAGDTPRKPYTEFLIADPTDQETFQNQRDIGIELKSEPNLQKKDKIQLFLDGVPYGEPQPSVHLRILQVARGTHVIYAVLLDNDNQVLKKSNIVTIYIHYASVGGAG
jgi:hypothetical protein